MYKVLEYFTDMQDSDHPYHPGDTFPRDGVGVSTARYAELSGSDNKRGIPLIKKVSEPKKKRSKNAD